MKKIAILFLLAATGAIAQPKHDPRPLQGRHPSNFPVLKSLGDLKAKPGGLINLATPAGNAEFVPAGNAQLRSQPKNNSKHTLPLDLSVWKVERASNGTANWMWRAWTRHQGIVAQSVKPADGMSVLEGLRTALRIADPASEFKPMSSVTDEIGQKHLRYAQYYHGIPVWNRDLYVHFDASGEPSVINGTYEPTPKNVDTIASISGLSAIDVATTDLKALGRWAPVGADVASVLHIEAPSAKLVLYPEQNSTIRLAYEVNVSANLLESYLYVIDASNGTVLTRIAQYCSMVPLDLKIAPVTASHFASTSNDVPLAPQSGFTNAQAPDLNGVNQTIRTYQHSDGKYYAIWDLPSFDAGTSAMPDNPQGGAITLTLNNNDFSQNASLYHNTSSDNSWSDPVLVSAHHNMLVTYNYYSSTFGRKAIDDKNGAIVSITHVTQNGAGMDNAFWTGAAKAMIYGDGNTDFKPLAGGMDVAGHEMTHGVINNSADLVYQFQSGALNESFADVFGVMIDSKNLTLAEDVMKDGKTCLRDMNDPHNDAGLSHQPATMSEYNDLTADQDNGGVHTNSGIPNKACAILINQLSRDKVQKMYYRALTVYLTRNSQFTDCRNAVQSAAKDLFGANSAEFNAVGPAFDAVGITGPPTDPSGNDLPSQTGGTQVIAFTNNTGQIGFLDPVAGTAQLATDPEAVARVSETTVGTSRAQLSAPRSGKHLWFIDQTGHLAALDIQTGAVSVLSALHLQTDGDLWNSAISSDESVVALTSAYLNDPNIYITDGTTIYVVPLKPENTDAGSLASIDYPDVLSWAPNASIPKIGFDALLSDQLGGTSTEYWSMYEIDLSSKKTYDLIPAQNSLIDIGNIAYSNTSPSVVTFNVVQNGIYDVAVADFKDNVIAALGVNQKAINGNAINDADKPSFSPDDQYLAFSSVSNNSVLFYQLSNQNLTFLQFTSPLFVPYWFLFGGSASVVKNGPSENIPSLQVYPGIISHTGTIEVILAGPENITLDIVNLFGQTVREIARERMNGGDHEMTFNATGLASGTYFIRLATKENMALKKIVIEK